MNATPLLAIAPLENTGASAAAMDEHWLPRFSGSERRRLERLARPQRRQQFVAAHALLRLAAACLQPSAAGADFAALRCEVDDDGRPRIDAPAGWQVSLSHSGAYVAVLIEPGALPVGVDLEQMRPERDILAIVRAACGVDAGSRDLAYRLWTAHEARVKAGHTGHAWHTQFDGHALAVAGTRRAPAGIVRFAWTGAASAERSVHAADWTAA